MISLGITNWLLVMGWMAAIVILPHFLGSGLPSPRSVLDELVRSGIHIVEYGILTLLLYRALKSSSHHGPSPGSPGQTGVGWKPYLLAFLIAALYAIFDEVQQSFIPNRQPSLLDFLTDSLGSLLTLSCIAAVSRSSRT